MTIDEIYERQYTFLKFSDYEIDFLLDKDENNVNQDSDSVMLNYLMGVENTITHQIENLKVTANIATQPSRFNYLLRMLESIDGQFDEIRIYLNNFREIPEELKKYTCVLGKDLTDNGKFFWVENKGEYYFTLDDDIIYPSDYVKKTIPLIGNRVVSYHGRNLYGLNQPYYNNHKVYSFYRQLSKEIKLDVAGTGVMAFNTNLFTPTLWKSPNTKMSDLIISLEAAMYGFQVVCLPRTKEWIKPIEYYNDGIYTDFLHDDKKQTSIADMILIYKNSGTKLDRSLMALTPTMGSVEDIYKKISDKIDNESNFSFYHLGCTNGNMIYHLSEISEFQNYVGIETVDERLEVCTSIIKESEFRSKIHFLNIKYDTLHFEENSILFINDWSISSEHTESVWDRLNNNCHLISTKMINAQPVDKFKIVTENDVELVYYYYIKSRKPIEFEFPYQKTLIVNLDDCYISKDRYESITNKFKYFNNPERFRATKGRADDWDKYVTDRWNWGAFNNLDTQMIKMSNGEIGCCMSHLRLWQKMVDEDIETCLVVEDDASKIIPGFHMIVSDLVKKLPEDWDVLLLGFLLFRDKGQKVSDEFYKIKEFVLTHCYLINKKGAQKFLQGLPIDSPIDTFMSKMSSDVNIYCHDFFRRRTSKRIFSGLIGQLSENKIIEQNTNKVIY